MFDSRLVSLAPRLLRPVKTDASGYKQTETSDGLLCFNKHEPIYTCVVSQSLAAIYARCRHVRGADGRIRSNNTGMYQA